MTVRIGITGESGFIGAHLAAHVRCDRRFRRIPFERSFFRSSRKLAEFTAGCDAIVHLAGESRNPDGEALRRINVTLTKMLASAASAAKNPPCVFLGSTTHISKNTPYHESKRISWNILKTELPHAVELLMPNTFGPCGRPFFNSVVSTFCFQAAHGETPPRIDPVTLKLIYIDDLCRMILDEIAAGFETRTSVIAHTMEITLPELWAKLDSWRHTETMPPLPTAFDAELWNTFRSYRS